MWVWMMLVVNLVVNGSQISVFGVTLLTDLGKWWVFFPMGGSHKVFFFWGGWGFEMNERSPPIGYICRSLDSLTMFSVWVVDLVLAGFILIGLCKMTIITLDVLIWRCSSCFIDNRCPLLYLILPNLFMCWLWCDLIRWISQFKLFAHFLTASFVIYLNSIGWGDICATNLRLRSLNQLPS